MKRIFLMMLCLSLLAIGTTALAEDPKPKITCEQAADEIYDMCKSDPKKSKSLCNIIRQSALESCQEMGIKEFMGNN